MILQNLAFDQSANAILVKLLEALYFSLLLKSAQDLTNWVETVVEAYFLQTSLFAQDKSEEQCSYEHDLLDKIQTMVGKEQRQLEDIA